MKKRLGFKIIGRGCFFMLSCLLFGKTLSAQQTQIRDYVIFSGKGGPGTTAPPAPGYGTFIGSSITVNGGSIGSHSLVQSTGNSFFSTNIYSSEKIIISNSNVITGRIAAANASSSNQTILQIGSSVSVGGNIDVNGNIVIGGGTVSGRVTHPPGTTYSGPVPGSGEVIGTPNVPLLPSLLPVTTFPAAGATNITNNRRITPGAYGDVILGSNKTLTLDGAGVYVFNSIHFSGNSTSLVFDFNNASSGNFFIYIHGDADLGKLEASTANGGSASRIYIETHGNGSTSTIPGYSYIIANGSSGGGSKGLGTVWAPYAGINIGSGTGSSTLTGALFSATQVIMQSGITFIYAPFGTCTVSNAGPDQNRCGAAGSVTLAANSPSSGSGTWSIVSGPSTSLSQFSNLSSPTSTFTAAGGTGSYTLRWTLNEMFCSPSTDDVVINFNPNPTTANAGPDQIGASTCGLTTTTLAGNAPTVGTGSWSIISGTGGAFGNTSNPLSTFTGTAGTTYTLRWTISNSPCPVSSDDVVIKFNQNPINVNAGPDKALNYRSEAILTGTTSTSGVSYNWMSTNGGEISPPNNQAQVTVKTSGIFVLTVTTAIGCSKKDTVEVTSKLTNVIGSELQSIYDNHNPLAPDTTSPFYSISRDGYVMVDVIAKAGYRDSVLRLLQQRTPAYPEDYGLRNIIPNGQNPFIITGEFPIINLPKLNLLGDIIIYCRPYYGAYNNIGLVTSAGDTTIRSRFVRNGYNIDGTGVKIGVLSDSYATINTATTAGVLNPVPGPPQTFTTNTAAQDTANGDLPGSPGNINGYTTPVHVLQDFPLQRTDEGRAMLQIVHDVAPGAELFFRTGFFTPGDFAVGIKQLRDAGCDIIVDDVTFITEPFLKDGVVAKTVDTVTSQGVKYFSAAGNFADKSYEKAFNPIDATSIGFPGKKAHNFGGGDVFQKVRLAPGNYTFVFQWLDNIYSFGETSGTTNDLDIYLTKNTNGTALVGYNRNNLNGDPIEFIPVTILGSDSVDYNVLIINNTIGADPARIKYVVFRGGIRFMEFNEGTSTVVGQANAAGAITVGAARYDKAPPYLTTPLIESFSSIGGTLTNGVVREKPDIVAPDGVNTTVKLGQDYPNSALDGFSNFFGTSAAAPHAAAGAALIIQGKKKFLGQSIITPSEIRSLFRATAVDMEISHNLPATQFDYISGYGLLNVDVAMRTFAAPRPHSIELVVPVTPFTIPGQVVFPLTIIGENFSTNSVIYYDSIPLPTVYISSTELRTTMPTFTGNPEMRVYTPPYPTTIIVNGQHLDGGFSNSLYFFDANIVISAVNITKKYGQTLPSLTATITINGTRLQDTTLTLNDIGLSSMTVSVPTGATNPGNVGTYVITPSRNFDTTNPADVILLQNFNYQFKTGTLTIEKLPLTVHAHDTTVVYGRMVPNIQFSYEFDTTNISNPAALLNTIKSSHQNQLARDAQGHDILGLVNGQAVTIVNGQAVTIVNGQAVTIVNGQALTIVNGQTLPVVNAQALTIANGLVTDTSGIDLADSTINNLSFLATDSSLRNSRQITNTNGTTKVVDITQESILDFNVNGAQAQMLNSVSNVNAKGLVDVESFLNGQALTIVNGQAITIVNGQAVTIVNGQAVTIVNGQAVTIVNGEPVPVISSDNKTAVIVNENEIGKGLSPLKSLNIISGLSVGEQFIIPGTITNGNFDITYIPGNLNIIKAPLQVKADNITRFFGDNNPPLTVSYSGFVYGENLQTSKITGAPSLTTIATATSPVSPPTYPIIVGAGTLASSNYSFNFVNGVLTIANNPCLLTHSAFKNFGNTPTTATSLWLNMETKVSGQLVMHGDYLLFKTGTVTFNNINSTPLVNNLAIPNGKIVADSTVSAPITNYDFSSNTWITKVPPGYSSTSDIFVTGKIINSSYGFVKSNGNTSSVLKGMFYSNRNFSDQWAYGIAAYVPQFSYDSIAAPGLVTSINGNYRAGTPTTQITHLVNGGSGGGGNNFTGSSSAFDNYTACPAVNPPITSQVNNLSLILEEVANDVSVGEVKIIPNPASGFVTISFVPKSTGSSRIIISTFEGKRLIEINNGVLQEGQRYQKKIDVSQLINGLYLFQVISADKIITKKIIILQ